MHSFKAVKDNVILEFVPVSGTVSDNYPLTQKKN